MKIASVIKMRKGAKGVVNLTQIRVLFLQSVKNLRTVLRNRILSDFQSIKRNQSVYASIRFESQSNQKFLL